MSAKTLVVAATLACGVAVAAWFLSGSPTISASDQALAQDVANDSTVPVQHRGGGMAERGGGHEERHEEGEHFHGERDGGFSFYYGPGYGYQPYYHQPYQPYSYPPDYGYAAPYGYGYTEPSWGGDEEEQEEQEEQEGDDPPGDPPASQPQEMRDGHLGVSLGPVMPAWPGSST